MSDHETKAVDAAERGAFEAWANAEGVFDWQWCKEFAWKVWLARAARRAPPQAASPCQEIRDSGDALALFQLQRQVEGLTAQVLAFQRSAEPFAALFNKSSGRIPTERLSFSHWHELANTWNGSMGLKQHTPEEIKKIIDNLTFGGA